MLFLWELKKKVEFSYVLMNLRVVQCQNKHNNESKRKYLSRELCEYYYLGLHKRLNNLRHRVYYLTKYIWKVKS